MSSSTARSKSPGTTSAQPQSSAAPRSGFAKAPLLDIRDLHVEYVTPRGPARAVDGVSFALAPGEVFGLAGESGSGKSTIAHAILRTLHPPAVITGGQVLFNGKDVLDMDGEQLEDFRWRDVSMVFQSAMNSLNPVMKIGDQITDVLMKHKMSAADARARAAELFNIVGIEKSRLDSYPHQLSGGMRHRIAIIRTLANAPDILLADEPFTALDEHTRRKIQHDFYDIVARTKKTVIFVTHNIEEAIYLADRMVVMSPSPGRIKQVVDIDLPRPRDILDLRFNDYRSLLFNLITPDVVE
jgi:peptide/nickel transport system ATP-binding protein